MRALALDYGAARTGVAVSDASGTLARPLCVVRKAATEAGLAEVARLVAEHEAERRRRRPAADAARRARQAGRRDRARSSTALRVLVAVPVETADERFTTALAQRFGGNAPEDAVAAAHLLQSWLDREARA